MFGTARVVFGTASVVFGIAKAVFGTARTVVGTARPDAFKSWDSLRPALADLEEPNDLEDSARLDVSDRRTPCDLPRPISRSPTICKTRPGSMSQIVGLLAIGLGQS